MMIDLLIRGGTLVDPANNRHGRFDVAVQKESVVEVAAELTPPARHVINARGKWVLPGIIDPHVHISGKPEGYRMLARAGVTCALDLAGYPKTMISGLQAAGTGLAVAFVYPLIPGETVESRNPGRAELNRVFDLALGHGALGVKILGGHYPLTPQATARVIQLAHQRRCWCAVHAGTTETGSNIDGLEELVRVADGLPLHIAHITSYCRGQRSGDPLLEASRALTALAQAPRARSESYLALINGTSAVVENGAPKSDVTKTCLQTGGYPVTAAGLEAAIEAGWAQVHGHQNGEIVLLPPTEGLAYYRRRDTQVWASFPVNSPGAAISLAVAKTNGQFTVTALSTDGGAIPRNTTLKQGLALVQFGALSIEEFVTKASLNPARMLGLESKGHLSPGADADLIVVDPTTARAEWVIAAGQVMVKSGNVVGQGGQLITTTAGSQFLKREGVSHRAVAPNWL